METLFINGIPSFTAAFIKTEVKSHGLNGTASLFHLRLSENVYVLHLRIGLKSQVKIRLFCSAEAESSNCRSSDVEKNGFKVFRVARRKNHGHRRK